MGAVLEVKNTGIRFGGLIALEIILRHWSNAFKRLFKLF